MRRRLFDGPDQGLGEELLLLEGDLPPWRQGDACSLVACLQAALTICGQPVTYELLMGQTGAAFMLHLAPAFPASAALEGREGHLPEAIGELGRTAVLLVEPSPEAALELCRGELAAGRPLLALGWGDHPERWALVVGLQGGDLLGHACGAGGRPRRQAPVLTRLVALGAPQLALDARQAALAALSRALALLQAGRAQYDLWRSLLEDPEPYGPVLGRLERFMAEQWLSACLVEARAAAVDYLEALAGLLGDAEADLLEPAVDCALRLAEATERLLVPPDAVHRAHLPEDLDWRQRRRESLHVLQSLEAELHDHLRHALRFAGDETLWGE